MADCIEEERMVGKYEILDLSILDQYYCSICLGISVD